MDSVARVAVTRRVLRLSDLVLYGLILIQPIAPVGIFGPANRASNGHIVTAILAGMVAMMLTAWSYGRMATLYPSAGSAYTYVSRGLNEQLGFLTGWAMVLDYLIIPVVNVIYVALTMYRLVPAVPYAVWATITALVITACNLRGIQFAAVANRIMLAIMSIVIVAFVVLSIRYLIGVGGSHLLFSFKPFYDPSTFHISAVATATSLAALTYIGFDGVTTLAEEVENPRRTVPIATVLVCLLTGVLSAVEVYLANQVWPDYNSFPNLETAFLDVTGRVGGPLLFQAMGAVLVVACFGSGLTGQAGAARLLYGMGRDDVLPKRFFGQLSAVRQQPTLNIVLIGVIALVGALAISYERAVEFLNFGAFLAFMGVNIAAVRRVARLDWRGVLSCAVSLAGFAFCFAIWLNLSKPAKIGGAVWLAVGLLYLAIVTRGFRVRPSTVDFSTG